METHRKPGMARFFENQLLSFGEDTWSLNRSRWLTGAGPVGDRAANKLTRNVR